MYKLSRGEGGREAIKTIMWLLKFNHKVIRVYIYTNHSKNNQMMQKGMLYYSIGHSKEGLKIPN